MHLAGAELDLGNALRARSLLERALGIAESAFGKSHPETSIYLNDLANPNLLLGAYPTARTLYERSLAIAEARFGRWHDQVATAVFNLALVDARIGDYRSARREYTRAAAIWQRVFGPRHPFVAIALVALASVHREEGAAAQALPLMERALAIRQHSLGATHPAVAQTLLDLAVTLMQLGQLQRAQTLATRALQIAEKADTPQSLSLASAFALYAELQARRGQPSTAREFYEKALAIREKAFGRSHPTFADTEAVLAATLAGLGEHAAALAMAVEAETTGRDHLRLMLRYLPERQSLTYAASRPRGMDLILSLVGGLTDASAVAMDTTIKGRALVLDEMAARRGELATGTLDGTDLRGRLASARQRLADLVVRGPGNVPPDRHETLVEEARRDAELAERTLAEQSAAFRAELSRDRLGLNEVSAALEEASTLVSFVRYERTLLERSSPSKPSSATTRQPLRTITSYLAFVLRPNQPPTAVPLGSASAIDRLAAQWRTDIASEATTSPALPDGTVARSSRTSGAALRKIVWDPLAPHLTGSKRIFIVPDGTLSLIPFVALPVGRNSYLLEQAPPIHYVSSERDLVLPPVESARTPHGLLALGGPAFDEAAADPR